MPHVSSTHILNRALVSARTTDVHLSCRVVDLQVGLIGLACAPTGLATLDDDRTAARVLDEGAAGYILKGTRQAAVIGAILAAHGGVTVLPGATRAALLAERHDGASVVLEPREREILLRIRNGLTNPEIARELFVSHSTIKADVARLLRKLGATKRAQAVARAHQLGVLE